MKKLKLILITLIVASGIFWYSVNFNVISGNSMYPTLENNNIITSFKHRKINVGDVVVFKPPKEWNKKDVLYIKRIIAKGGDEIKIENDKLYVNDVFLKDISKWYKTKTKIKFKIEDGFFFLMGDNTAESADSLYYMLNDNFRSDFLVPKKNIVSSVKLDSKDEEVDKYVKMYNK